MIKIISAGAGSGKTYRLTQEMVALLRGGTRASGIIATTFTSKAAAELQERVSTKLLEEGLTEQANDLSNALIGTVHGLGVKLLKRFAFEAGVSPQVDIIADEDQQVFFNQSLAQILTYERVERMNELAERLGMGKRGNSYDWRRDVRQLVDVARANNFDKNILEDSKKWSFLSFQQFLGAPTEGVGDYNAQLQEHLTTAIENLEGGSDDTKVTSDGINELKQMRNELRFRGSLHWHQWVKLMKTKVGAKSKVHLEELLAFAASHTQFVDFQKDIRDFIDLMFDIAIAAIDEYDRFKKERGLIDYTDMEVHIRRLLDDPSVKSILEDELDLLMVDEFQDTSPLQLDIFLKLSKIAKHSIWVGDPKQSIYGFRGAEPRLMHAIIAHIGIRDEDILKDSWRSRPDIVYATNAIFKKAFQDLPVEQIALNPKRTDGSLQSDALIHWHFMLDNGGDKRIKPNQEWFEGCLAESIRTFLERNYLILPKGSKEYRAVQPGDIAILCRTNDQGRSMANALHRVGLKAAIARTGLLETAEVKLILAVLRYILNKHDSLSVAEILLLAEKIELTDIIEHRLEYLAQLGEDNYNWRWAVDDNNFIKKINDLRSETKELSSNEILNLVLDELDLRRIIAAWGNTAQRLDNVDVVRQFSVKYESACNRLHTAASLGGFLLWLNELAERDLDTQSSGESGDAINILTYHKSKGLEYPVVIMGSLEQRLRDNVFGIALESSPPRPVEGGKDENSSSPIEDEGGIDLDNILGNRWLRFWVNPYADQLGKTELEERLNESAVKAKARLEALAEEARLLYVGITRARDYLVFPTYNGGITRWLNRAWHHGNEELPVLDEGNETHFEWEGRYLPKEYEETWFEKSHRHTADMSETPSVHFLEPRDGKAAHVAYKIDVEKEHLNGHNPLAVGDTEGYAPQLHLKEDAVAAQVAKAVDAFMTADSPTLPAPQRLQTAKAIVERYNVAEDIDFQNLVRQSNALFDFLNKKYTIIEIAPRYPVRTHHNHRLYEGEIDFLIKTTEGVIILHNTHLADAKKIKSEAARYLTKLFLSKKAVATLFKTAQIECYVHCVLLGVVVKVA